MRTKGIKAKDLLLGLVTILTAASFTGCGSDAKETTEIRIGYFNNVTHAQALLMKADGSLQEALSDVEVKWTAFNAGPAEVEALFADEIDIGYIGPVPAVSANVKSKGDVQIISSATKGGAILVKREGADINGVEDLSGKTVAIPQIGNTQHLALLHLLKENGLSPVTEGGDVNVAAVANADVANVMGRGDVDAALVPEPWGTTLLSQGAELVLDYDAVYFDGDYDVAVVVVRKEFAQNHPELVEQFLKVHEKATETLQKDRAGALQKMNGQLEEDTGKSLSEEILTTAFTRIGVSTKLNKESILQFAKISQEQEFIATLPGEDLFYESGN